MGKKADKKTLNFITNVQLKSIIGKDLINDDNIAILELVKNSFDADAKKVQISFLNLKNNDDDALNKETLFTSNTSKVVIQDDGVGMDFDDVVYKWLNIAYSEKKTNSRQYNRLMAGAKGVGRFSCDRLGEYLNLYAKKENSTDYIKIHIDWKKFEVENDVNLQIQQVPIEYDIITKEDIENLGLNPIENGVILEIIKLRSKWAYLRNHKKETYWDFQKLIDLKKYLEKLINPNQAFTKDDFGIFLDAPDFAVENDSLSDPDKFIGRVENRIFEKLDFRATTIESKIIDDGRVIYTELKDRGDTVFWIKEKNPYLDTIQNTNIIIYYLNTYAKAFFTKQTGIQPVNYGSVFLFINGFRVPPYGELGNDWLQMDNRKGQGYARYLGSRDIVGRIEILDSKNDFKIISSREGVVRNDSLIALTNQNDGYFYKVFKRLEKYVVDGLNWDSTLEDNKYNEIEKKVFSGDITQDNIKFKENEKTKRRRIYNSIHSIIAAKPNEVVELYINEDLIEDKIDEEKKQSIKEFRNLLVDFEKKKIDPETLEQILLAKAQHHKELEKQIKQFSKYSTNEATTKAIAEIQDYKKTLESQTKALNDLKAKLLEVEKEKAEKDKEVQEIKAELEETQSQNLFLKSIKSQEFEDVLNLMHHVGVSTSTIQNYIRGIIYRIENDGIDKDVLKKALISINAEVNKIYSISRFATKANFKLGSKAAHLDIVGFVKEYLINIFQPYLPTSISLNVNAIREEFVIDFKPLELTILIDNLINNSRKAGAKNITVDFEMPNTYTLLVKFKDDGIGVPNKFADKIFDYGFTTTEGSGLGLAHIKEIVESIGGDIQLNKDYNKGAEFIIKLNKK